MQATGRFVPPNRPNRGPVGRDPKKPPCDDPWFARRPPTRATAGPSRTSGAASSDGHPRLALASDAREGSRLISARRVRRHVRRGPGSRTIAIMTTTHPPPRSATTRPGRMHERLDRRRTPDRCRRIHAIRAARGELREAAPLGRYQRRPVSFCDCCLGAGAACWTRS